MTLVFLNQSPHHVFTETFENVRFVIKFSPSEGITHRLKSVATYIPYLPESLA